MAPSQLLSSVLVRASRPYSVHVGSGALGLVRRELDVRSGCAVVTDENVGPRYLASLEGLERAPSLALVPGEASKAFGTLERVLDFMADAGLDRGSCLIALGGGVVGDLAGLAASLYMRGISVVQCPTTLLAQVDASVGGKTAVNLRRGKNLAGTFHQPCSVYADTDVLRTLADDEFRSGLGEVVKTAILSADGLFELLEESALAIRSREPGALTEVVTRSIRVKADLVARDERETGLRQLLNLGHTFAHAIEHAAGYGRVPHGVAVAVGLGLALEASRRLALLADPGLPQRVERLLVALGLETDLGGLRASRGVELPAEALRLGMRSDKKGQRGEVRLVLPRAIGEVEHGVTAPESFWRGFPF